jgi:UDP-N-acetyl-D-glucosamine dehydrogenase
MPYHVVERIGQALDSRGKVLCGARVLILGVAFKRDVDDARNSPAERIMELLLNAGAQVAYNDPHVPSYSVGGDVFCRQRVTLTSQDLTPALLADHDVVVIVSGHRAYDYDWIVRHASLLVDPVNATQGVAHGREKIVRIGEPFYTLPPG